MLLLGIDEAGYGPTLGPLCHGLSAWCVPERLTGPHAPDLWEVLAPAVCHSPAPPRSGALELDDSKKVFTGPHKLERLRRSVACCLACATSRPPGGAERTLLTELLPREDLARLERDPWGCAPPDAQGEARANTCVPGDAEALARLRERLTQTGLELVALTGRALPAGAFNARLAATGSKAEVAWERVAELLHAGCALARPGEAVLATVDRQGGRKFYAAALCQTFEGALVQVEQESALRSAYRLERPGGTLRVEFLVEAESHALPVALASLAAKFIREACMARFNAFFADHVPGLAPTAGYPQDARRFLADSAAAREKLGIRDQDLVRQS